MLGVVGTMLAAVLDRRRELGVLRAIGASRRQIVLLVVAESGFLGLCAVVSGCLTAVPMGWVLVRVIGLVNTGWAVDYQFSLPGAARVGISVIATALLAGLVPGRRAARLDVAEAVSHL
jgi:putative ABC transport system permease protein